MKARLLMEFFMAPYLGLGLGYNWVLSSVFYADTQDVNTDFRTKQRRGYLSLQPSVGVDMPLWIGLISAEFVFEYGLTKLTKDNVTFMVCDDCDIPPQTTSSGNMVNFMILTGYRIGF